MKSQLPANLKVILPVTITLTALIVGSVVYVWQQSVAQKEVQQAIERARQEAMQQNRQPEATPPSSQEGTAPAGSGAAQHGQFVVPSPGDERISPEEARKHKEIFDRANPSGPRPAMPQKGIPDDSEPQGPPAPPPY